MIHISQDDDGTWRVEMEILNGGTEHDVNVPTQAEAIALRDSWKAEMQQRGLWV